MSDGAEARMSPLGLLRGACHAPGARGRPAQGVPVCFARMVSWPPAAVLISMLRSSAASVGAVAGAHIASERAFAGNVPTIGVRSDPAHGHGEPAGHHAGLEARYSDGGSVRTELAGFHVTALFTVS